jgi:glycerate kinase
MHILIAPNAFKNSLSASDAANAILDGLMDSKLDCSMECFPVGDGGDGTAPIIVQHFGGFFTNVRASDPLGRKINAPVGFIDEGKTAVIEMADVSGLKLLQSDEHDPLHATSYGCGELICAALNYGSKKIILGVGGSATVDGGCGALQAMGVRFLDASGNELTNLPGSLTNLHSIDISGIDKRIFETEFIILCDVDNFLLGSKGAASVFGPQKGASERDVIQLENALTRLRDISFIQTGSDLNKFRYGGAAGGISAGLHVYLNAKLVQGIDYFLETTRFDNALENTDILITGEGSIDLQTLEGKGPFGVASRAKKKNIRVIGLAGKVLPTEITELNDYFDVLIAINQPNEDLKTAMLHTSANLRRSSMELGKMIAGGI